MSTTTVKPTSHSHRMPHESALVHAGNGTGRNGFDLGEWVRRMGLPVQREAEWGNGGRKWILAACPFNEEHSRGEAYIVRRADGAISAGCHHNSCRHWGWRELRQKFEPGCY